MDLKLNFKLQYTRLSPILKLLSLYHFTVVMPVPVHDHTRTVKYSTFLNSLNPSKVLSTACGLPLALCAVRAATSVEVRRPCESRGPRVDSTVDGSRETSLYVDRRGAPADLIGVKKLKMHEKNTWAPLMPQINLYTVLTANI